MDYYRRYIGDYLAKTQGLTMIQDGAYSRLLDYYYANEAALPISLKEIYEIARANTAAARKAVDRVLELKFELEADGYHNDRADKELAIALPAMEAHARAARENGKKGGRPRKTQTEPTSVVDNLEEENPDETHAGCYPQPSLVPTRASQATPIPQPKDQKHRFPGIEDIPAPEPKAAETQHINPDDMARIVAECARANLENPTAANAMIQRWAQHGATPTLIANALAEARRSVNPANPLTCAYVDPIIERLIDQDRKARNAAKQRVQDTLDENAKQAAWISSPMPEHLRPRRPSGENHDNETLDS